MAVVLWSVKKKKVSQEDWLNVETPYNVNATEAFLHVDGLSPVIGHFNLAEQPHTLVNYRKLTSNAHTDGVSSFPIALIFYWLHANSLRWLSYVGHVVSSPLNNTLGELQ